MYYINPNKQLPLGPAQLSYADGLVALPEKFFPIFYPSDKRAAGFVNIEHNGTIVTSCDWNEEAYQLWCEENPVNVVTPDLAPQIQVAMMAFAATSTTIPDSYALDMPDLFPLWEDVLAAGEKLTKGTILNDGGQLYRVSQEDVLPQKHQPPHGEGMTAVYVPINRSNAGTLEDPIPAVRGMEYTYGLYYFDPEDQKIYLCKRDNEPEGGTVTLQYLPHEQTPHYFEAI